MPFARFTLICRETETSLSIGAEPETDSGAPLLPKAARAKHHTHRNIYIHATQF